MGKEKDAEREVAQLYFVDLFMDAKTIAEKLKISENTIGKWRKKFDWDKIREDTINNPIKMRKLLAEQMILIASGEKSIIDADALSKMYKVYEGISERINPGIVAAVLKIYDEFLAKRNPKLALENLPYNKEFLIHIINTYGQ